MYLSRRLCLLMSLRAFCAGGLLSSAQGFAADVAMRERLKSGPEVGAAVHAFFVRAVTGPLRNRSVCYVCRNGDRPVVMVFFQGVDPNAVKFMKMIDRMTDAGRVNGARSFGVLVTDNSGVVVPTLQTLAFDGKIEMPLTAATTAIAGPSSHSLNPDAATTVVLYRHQKVVASFGYRRGDLVDTEIERIQSEIEAFLEIARPS